MNSENDHQRGEGYINDEEIEEEIELDDDDDGGEAGDGKAGVEDENLEEFLEEGEDDPEDDAIGHFTGHNEAVLCCDVSSDDRLVVTGGQDDKAVVWEAATQQTLFEIGGHKDSVVVASFNVTSTMVATADMAGLVQVHDTTGERKADYEVDDINWMFWHPQAESVLLAGTKAGDAWMWKISNSNPQTKTFQSFGTENMCATIFKDGRRVAMGYEDGSIRIWDMKEMTVVHTISGPQAHREHVICMDLNADDSLLATGSLDSTVKIFNTSTGKPILTIAITGHPHPNPNPPSQQNQQNQQHNQQQKTENGSNISDEEGSDSVESVAFSGKSILAIGSVNGVFEVWDVAACAKRHELNLGGICKIAVDRQSQHLLYTGCLDGHFRVLDLRTAEVLADRAGHTDSILDFAISADSRYALTTSEDATCRIFSLV